jgi:hypothetical protein
MHRALAPQENAMYLIDAPYDPREVDELISIKQVDRRPAHNINVASTAADVRHLDDNRYVTAELQGKCSIPFFAIEQLEKENQRAGIASQPRDLDPASRSHDANQPRRSFDLQGRPQTPENRSRIPKFWIVGRAQPANLNGIGLQSVAQCELRALELPSAVARKQK